MMILNFYVLKFNCFLLSFLGYLSCFRRFFLPKAIKNFSTFYSYTLSFVFKCVEF